MRGRIVGEPVVTLATLFRVFKFPSWLEERFGCLTGLVLRAPSRQSFQELQASEVSLNVITASSQAEELHQRRH